MNFVIGRKVFHILLLWLAGISIAGAQGPGGFNTNLRLWLKANTGVTGSPVQTWTDQSVNGFSATQATVASRPAILNNRVNFNPAIQFDGLDDQLVIASGIVAATTFSNVNIFAILRTNTIAASSVLREDQSAAGRLNIHVPWTDNNLYWDAGSTSAIQRISTPWVSVVNTNYLWSFTASTTSIPSTSAQGQEIYKNGLILASDASMASFTGSNSSMSIGNGFGFYNGEIAELVVYNGVITAAQLQRIHSYLALKYGITLDQSTPQNYVASNSAVIWNGATYNGYKNDIAGIGRDDNSVLDQRKSISSNNSPVDIITTANTNFAAPTAFGIDRQFLMWGNNGLTTSANISAASFVHNGVTIVAKSQRNWSTAKIGAPPGNAIVEVNMALVGGPSGVGTNANTDLRLLIDNDATFGNASAGELTISPTAGFPATGGVVDFIVPYANISATQGFFSIGSVNKVTCPLAAPSPGGTPVATRLWLKADAGVTGSPVSTWIDQSVNGFTANQGTVANRPTFLNSRINFNPAVQFDGVSKQLLITGGIMGTSTYTNFNVFAVLRTNIVVGSSVFYETQSAGGRINIHVPWSDNNLYWDAGSAGGTQRLSTAWTGVVNTNYVWSFTASTTSVPTTSAAGQEIYKNGALLASDNTMSAFTGNSSDLYLGSLSGANFYNGEIAEIVIYNGAFTTSQVQNVHSYLAAKYGITLDQTSAQNYYASDWNGATGTLFWNAASAATYKTDIAVIGRDDNSSFNQKQSASVNGGNVLSIGNVAIAADNQSNGNTFSADRSFFSWAHNNLALSGAGVNDFGTTVNAVVMKGRLARVWFSQENGTVGSVKLRFDLSTVPGVYDWANSRLLVDADGVFAAGATAVAPTTFNNGTGIVDFDFDFVAGTGFYFTIGSTNLVTTPLPVELTKFTANASNEDVKLSWTTATELNNDYFVVEISSDGELWRDVTTVKGKGTTTKESVYSAIDTQPIFGVSYYRLRQVDFDGTRKFSKIVTVTFEGSGIKMYPNPVDGGDVTFELTGQSIATGLKITSMQGLEVYRCALPDSQGQKQLFRIDVRGFSPGVYIVTIFSSDALHHTKLVIR